MTKRRHWTGAQLYSNGLLFKIRSEHENIINVSVFIINNFSVHAKPKKTGAY